MPYRRNQQIYRRHPYFSMMSKPTGPVHDDAQDELKAIAGIPLPNEAEIPYEKPDDEKRKAKKTNILDFFKNHIKVEDIILVGLIFLLIEEGIEDELLLLVLVFLLLG
jgi:hypothetical protein